jgi:glycosyltransferase involved in cell wall biosynthesis
MGSRILVCAYACVVDPAVRFPGGGDLMAWSLVKRLGRAQRLWVLTAAQNREALETALKKEPLPSVEFHYVDLPGWLHPLLRHRGSLQFYAYLWQWKAYLVARKLHQRVHFNAFHHLSYDNDWMASIIGALLPVPYLRGPGGGAHRTPKAFVRNYPLRERCWERVRTIGQWLYRHDPFFVLGRRRAKAILVGNREALNAVPRKWHHKVQLFQLNGVPSTAFDGFTARPQPREKYRILTAGRLVRLKGFDLAIEAFKIFVERTALTGWSDGVELAIVGDGPELPRLRGLVRGYGLQEQVRFETWKPQEELWSTMRACDVFLFPSLRDGGGLVVVEAMAAGKPVICVDLAGPGMHVTEDCGVKVAPLSPEQVVGDLAAALERLGRDNELRLQMGAAARKRAEQLYHWDRLGERMLEIYQDALGIQQGEA